MNLWDTDQFPNNVAELALAFHPFLKAGGFSTGGLNFDAKLRRQSIDPEDLFFAHIGGMDACARPAGGRGEIEDGKLDEFVEDRYAGWNSELGHQILSGEVCRWRACPTTCPRRTRRSLDLAVRNTWRSW